MKYRRKYLVSDGRISKIKIIAENCSTTYESWEIIVLYLPGRSWWLFFRTFTAIRKSSYVGIWTDDTTDAQRGSKRGIYTGVLARARAKYLELGIYKKKNNNNNVSPLFSANKLFHFFFVHVLLTHTHIYIYVDL